MNKGENVWCGFWRIEGKKSWKLMIYERRILYLVWINLWIIYGEMGVK
jgi:hypothetical protein